MTEPTMPPLSLSDKARAYRCGFTAGVVIERARIRTMLYQQSDGLVDGLAMALHDALRTDPRFSKITPWAECDDGWKHNDRVKARAVLAALAQMIEPGEASGK